MGKTKRYRLPGKLDLPVLRILACGDSMHGCAIAERNGRLSESVLQVGEESLYPWVQFETLQIRQPGATNGQI